NTDLEVEQRVVQHGYQLVIGKLDSCRTRAVVNRLVEHARQSEMRFHPAACCVVRQIEVDPEEPAVVALRGQRLEDGLGVQRFAETVCAESERAYEARTVGPVPGNR